MLFSGESGEAETGTELPEGAHKTQRLQQNNKCLSSSKDQCKDKFLLCLPAEARSHELKGDAPGSDC